LRCGAWTVGPAEGGDGLVLTATAAEAGASDGLDGLRALCVAQWTRHPGDGAVATVVAGDERSAGVLAEWGLLPS
jgi:hypothetical protein